MARDVARWLARKERAGAHGDNQGALRRFHHHHRSLTVLPPTSDEAASRESRPLLDRTEAGARPVRLLGVGVHNLQTSEC